MDSRGGRSDTAAPATPKGCPVVAMRNQVTYLQRNYDVGETPISSFKKGDKWQQIRGDNITAAIRAVIRAAGPSIGFTQAYISARSLCAGGGMDLLMEGVDPDTIGLVGRWRSNMMLRYLQMMVKSFNKGLLDKMFEHGTYALILTVHSSN